MGEMARALTRILLALVLLFNTIGSPLFAAGMLRVDVDDVSEVESVDPSSNSDHCHQESPGGSDTPAGRETPSDCCDTSLCHCGCIAAQALPSAASSGAALMLKVPPAMARSTAAPSGQYRLPFRPPTSRFL